MDGSIERLEQDVLRLLLEGDDPVLDILRSQERLAKRKPSTMSGVGFFTDFEVARHAPRLLGNPSFSFGDVIAEIEGLRHGAGFVLFVDNGLLAMLEGYTYDEAWPEEVSQYNLRYMSGENRDLAALQKTPGWPTL